MPKRSGYAPPSWAWQRRYGAQEVSQFRSADMIAGKWGITRAEMEDFAECVRDGRPTRVPGEEGLRELPLSDAAVSDPSAIPATGRRSAPIRALALMLEQWLPQVRGSERTSAAAPDAGYGPTPGVPTLRDGLEVQRVIDAARRSSDGAGWVSLQA